MFLGGSFPRGNYVGNKSSERPFSSAAISRGILSGGSYFWGDCPGAIIQRAIVWGPNFLGGNCPGGNFPLGQFSKHPEKITIQLPINHSIIKLPVLLNHY